jgi:predicted nucleotidyltransferase
VSVRPEQLARTLRARHAARLARAEVRAEELRRRLEPEVRALLAEGLVRRAWLIGSLAWGGFDATSDVDVVVEGLEERASPAVWGRLGDALGVEVDLLRLESLEAAFAERVRERGVPIGVG